MDDPLNLLPQLLDLPKSKTFTLDIIKNPGPHSSWIKNWEEINQIIKDLEDKNNDFYKCICSSTG